MTPRTDTAAVVIGVLLLLAAPPARATPERVLEEAADAYVRSDFQTVIKLVRPLLYPRIQLTSQGQVIPAYKLLGISYLFEKDKVQAEKQFWAILSLKPDYALDPLVDPPAAVKFLAHVKKRNADKIKAILERERLERVRRRVEADRRREEDRRRALLAAQSQEVVERTIVRRALWISFVPFGAGQLQNGHRRKGFALLGGELALGALSLGTAIAVRFAYPNGLPRGDDTARALDVVKVASGALFFGAMAYGIIDALIYYRPQTVSEQRYQRKRSWSVSPTAASSGLGLELDLTY
jgi:hypothetical protein